MLALITLSLKIPELGSGSCVLNNLKLIYLNLSLLPVHQESLNHTVLSHTCIDLGCDELDEASEVMNCLIQVSTYGLLETRKKEEGPRDVGRTWMLTV